MTISVCVAGATGWTGSEVTRHILGSTEFQLTGALARQKTGTDIGEVLGQNRAGIPIVSTLAEALQTPPDVLIDYTYPTSVKARTLEALEAGVRVIIGTSGLTAADFAEIDQAARARQLGVIAAGNFSLTAALAKHFSLIAARYMPSWEILDYAGATKADAPSGTTRELAEEMSEVATNRLGLPLDQTIGLPEARGATVGSTQIHSLRLPGYVLAFETLFGLPDERLTIRHDAGSGATPYVSGTLLAASRVMNVTGLVRGLDRLLFQS